MEAGRVHAALEERRACAKAAVVSTVTLASEVVLHAGQEETAVVARGGAVAHWHAEVDTDRL